MIQQSTFGYLAKIIEIRNLKRYLHFHIHCSIVCNSQDMDTTYVTLFR